MKAFVKRLFVHEFQKAQFFAEAERTLEAMRKLTPVSREEILEGLAGGQAEPAARSVQALVMGLKELAVQRLRNPETGTEQATMLRGHLAALAALEELLAASWAEVAKRREKAAKQATQKGNT